MDTFLRLQPVAMMEQPISCQKWFPTRSLQKPDLKVVLQSYEFLRKTYETFGEAELETLAFLVIQGFSRNPTGWNLECAGSTEFLTSCYFEVLFHLSTFNLSDERWIKEGVWIPGREYTESSGDQTETSCAQSKQSGWKPDWSVFVYKLVHHHFSDFSRNSNDALLHVTSSNKTSSLKPFNGNHSPTSLIIQLPANLKRTLWQK